MTYILTYIYKKFDCSGWLLWDWFLGFVKMSQKRQSDEAKGRSEGNSTPEEKKRKFHLRNVVQDVMKMQSFQHLLEPILEPVIRRVVKEEFEIALKKHLMNLKRCNGKDVDSPESRSFKLQFSNSLSLPVFTGARIDGDDGSNVKVVLIDILTGKIVSSGAESSAKVEIVVLEGDFDSEEGDNWTQQEFSSNIVREREGKKPLLTGDVFLNLKEGIGLVSEISFTDNSSWTRSRKFRLGARVVDNFNGTLIREAKTESFIVRDHRGELYKKHHPPTLFDEVWRLEKIGKDGAFHKRLSRENIRTVRDFLTMLFLNPTKLRNILGTGMSAKMWEVTVEHARTCTVDKRLFCYCPAGLQPKTGVIFNIVGQVLGLLSECQYVPLEKMSDSEKIDAQNLVSAAFEHQDEVTEIDDETSLHGGLLHLSNIAYTSSSLGTENSCGSKLLPLQKIDCFDYAQPSISSPDIVSSMFSVNGVNGLDDFPLHNIENVGLRYDHALSFPTQVSNQLICDTDAIAQAFCDEDHLPFFDPDFQHHLGLGSQADLQTLLAQSGVSSALMDTKAHRRWKMISSVFKWFSIRRLVAARKSHRQ